MPKHLAALHQMVMDRTKGYPGVLKHLGLFARIHRRLSICPTAKPSNFLTLQGIETELDCQEPFWCAEYFTVDLGVSK